MNDYLFYFFYILIGLVAGSLTGFTGGSGMSVLMSGLLLLNVDIRNIIGLTFIITLVNSLASLPAYIKNRNIDFKVSFMVGLPAAAAVIPGFFFSQKIENQFLVWGLTGVLFLLGIRMLFSRSKHKNGKVKTKITHPALLILFGIILGLLIGLFGGGGGIFIGIFLMLIFRFPVKEAVGNSILIMGLAAISGLVINFSNGQIELWPALLLAVPSVLAALITSHFANRVNPRLIKVILGIYLIVASILLIVKQIL